MGSREERVNAESIRVCMFHGIPITNELEAFLKIVSQALFAREITLSLVVIDKAVLLQVV